VASLFSSVLTYFLANAPGNTTRPHPSEIRLMQRPNFSEVRITWRLEALRQHSDSILMALAIANDNGGLLKSISLIRRRRASMSLNPLP
jgi:hypothetical protein